MASTGICQAAVGSGSSATAMVASPTLKTAPQTTHENPGRTFWLSRPNATEQKQRRLKTLRFAFRQFEEDGNAGMPRFRLRQRRVALKTFSSCQRISSCTLRFFPEPVTTRRMQENVRCRPCSSFSRPPRRSCHPACRRAEWEFARVQNNICRNGGANAIVQSCNQSAQTRSTETPTRSKWHSYLCDILGGICQTAGADNASARTDQIRKNIIGALTDDLIFPAAQSRAASTVYQQNALSARYRAGQFPRPHRREHQSKTNARKNSHQTDITLVRHEDFPQPTFGFPAREPPNQTRRRAWRTELRRRCRKCRQAWVFAVQCWMTRHSWRKELAGAILAKLELHSITIPIDFLNWW